MCGVSPTKVHDVIVIHKVGIIGLRLVKQLEARNYVVHLLHKLMMMNNIVQNCFGLREPWL